MTFRREFIVTAKTLKRGFYTKIHNIGASTNKIDKCVVLKAVCKQSSCARPIKPQCCAWRNWSDGSGLFSVKNKISFFRRHANKYIQRVRKYHYWRSTDWCPSWCIQAEKCKATTQMWLANTIQCTSLHQLDWWSCCLINTSLRSNTKKHSDRRRRPFVEGAWSGSLHYTFNTCLGNICLLGSIKGIQIQCPDGLQGVLQK